MTLGSSYTTDPLPKRTFISQNPAAGASGLPSKRTGSKRGRKPKNTTITSEPSGAPPQTSPTSTTGQYTQLQWDVIQTIETGSTGSGTVVFKDEDPAPQMSVNQAEAAPLCPGSEDTTTGITGDSSAPDEDALRSQEVNTTLDTPVAKEDGEREDEVLSAMADDDYSTQLLWQSQYKDDLKYAYVYFLFGQYMQLNLL